MPGPNSLTPMQETVNTGGPYSDTSSTVAALKRSASSAFESAEDSSSRKKMKEGMDQSVISEQTVDGQALADELEQELQCGCCSALVYRPVLVHPCQHFFCGSCVVLWVRNGGTNCPACRGISLSVAPSRALQTMADVLSRAAPSRARTVAERMQADEIYKSGLSIRIPTPRLPSPEPNLQANGTYAHPCPHCAPGNQWGWRCAHPIADPDADPDNAWNSEEGPPPGHAYCGNCENILALQAPTTTKCDFCQVSFCGIGIPGRCVATSLVSQYPHGLSDLADLVQCGEIYDCFEHNPVEVEIMFDYLAAQNFTPRHIYKEIIAMILRSPRQFHPLFDLNLFLDMHTVDAGIDPDPTAPRQRICRVCATEVLLWGLRDWWVQERKKGFLEEDIMKRPDCPEGSTCVRQKDHVHSREFNHIILQPDAPEAPIHVSEDITMREFERSTRPLTMVLPSVSIDMEPDALPLLVPQHTRPGPSSEVLHTAHVERAMVFTLPVADPSALQSAPVVPSSQDQVNAML